MRSPVSTDRSGPDTEPILPPAPATAAVVDQPVDPHGGVELREHLGGARGTGEHAVGTRDHFGDGAARRRGTSAAVRSPSGPRSSASARATAARTRATGRVERRSSRWSLPRRGVGRSRAPGRRRTRTGRGTPATTQGSRTGCACRATRGGRWRRAPARCSPRGGWPPRCRSAPSPRARRRRGRGSRHCARRPRRGS